MSAMKKAFVVEATAAGKKGDLGMYAWSIRTRLLTAIIRGKRIEVDALEKIFSDLTRTNILGGIRYLVSRGWARRYARKA
jgi:hypothetical protein